MIRAAIYYTPHPSSQLSRAAAQWLGRDSISLCVAGYRPAQSVAFERYNQLVAGPFHYGFHATIKPPFRLVDGVTLHQVSAKLQQFALQQRCFILPALEVKRLHDFFCLRPTTSCTKLDELAAATVEAFDEFRQPVDARQLEKRRAAGLTPRQDYLLQKWGYPYVMDEFRFHLTLTGRVVNTNESLLVEQELKRRFPASSLRQQPFSTLSLFVEVNNQPMRLFTNFALSPTI
ncbi:MAG: DUF1045 domain-containing protein [Desulfopila sp.]